MLTTLMVVLAAAPVEVLVVLPSSARSAALQVAPKGRTFVDASAIYEHLLAPPAMLDFQDFNGFTDAPMAGWPAELREQWTSGVAYCREISGPPPWRKTLPGSRCCGRRLGLHLWGRYLASLKATEVFVLRASDSRDDGVVVTGVRFSADKADELQITQTGADPAQLVPSVFTRLLKNEGERSKRLAVNRLFVAEPGDPWAQEAAPATPLELKPRCDRLPAKLTFKSNTPTAQALQARWADAARGTGPDLECSMQFSSHEELPEGMMPMALPVVTSILRCGDVTVSNELAKTAMVKAPLDSVTRGLAQELAARLCR